MHNDQLKNEAVYLQDRYDRYLWQQTRVTGLSRRRLLQLLATGAVGARCAWPGTSVFASVFQGSAVSEPCVVKPTPPELFIPRGGANYEMRFDVIPDHQYLVPNELFFIRSHGCTPRLDAGTWRLRIDGDGVENPIELTYDDILGMDAVTVRRFVECAGNGRGFYGIQQGQRATGAQWFLGAIGVAEWTGVRLSDVLQLAGLKDTAVEVMPEGLDSMIGQMGHVRRPIPIEKALEDDTLLVYRMNGETLLEDHGFPARVLVPGWMGVASIKWVGHIEVSETPLFSPFGSTVPPFDIQTYRLFGDDYPPEGVLLTLQNVKSAFELPFPAQLSPGKQVLHGRSWSGNGTIQHVEVSFDGDRWRRADLRSENLPQAWVRWTIEWHAEPGEHILRARATDETGQVQLDTVPFNKFGYTFGAIVNYPITVQ